MKKITYIYFKSLTIILKFKHIYVPKRLLFIYSVYNIVKYVLNDIILIL